MVNLNELEKKFRLSLTKAKTREDVEKIRVTYFGRKKGILTKISSEFPKLSSEEKRKIGPLFNKVKNTTKKLYEDKIRNLPLQKKTIDESSTIEKNNEVIKLPFDPTIPADKYDVGHSHPLTKVIDEVKNIFHYLGFSWVDGPEVESIEYNFEKLLIGEEHPSRDYQQTYYLDNKFLLRTHTSPMQIRYMETHKPPIRIISPGRVYRRDMPDATHLPDFMQIEGLLIDEKASLTDLMGVLDFTVKRLFGNKSKVRFYGHNFPYTEPSIEVEVFHEKRGWIEILGSGMIHPDVLQNGGIDPEKYHGWAFGIGPDRLAMLKYGIDDIRLLYSGDMRFLKQF